MDAYIDILIYIMITVVGIAIGILGTILIQNKLAISRAKSIIEEAGREGEVIRQKELLKSREEGMKIKEEAEKAANQRLSKVQSVEAKMKKREMELNQVQQDNQRQNKELETRRQKLDAEESVIASRKEELDKLKRTAQDTLEHISGLSADEAKEKLVESMKDEAKTAAASYINDIMDEAKMTANKEAKRIVIQTIQRVATEAAIENSVTVFHIDSDEIKGRIIGREGRNIRALEAATGVDLIIDDTPETVILSAYSPLRRQVARMALERLIQDGRIHPARIEDIVQKCEQELDAQVREVGEQATFDAGVHGIHPEIVRLLGQLRYRTSFTQNVLQHSLEVSALCGMMAAELGMDVKKAKRAGLLHDIGKAVDHEVEGPHALIGADLAKKYNESQEIIHAIAAHHEDQRPSTALAVLVQAADSISGARPGARKELLENYVKRLEDLEGIATSFDGVAKAYAIQAGREVRVMVAPDVIDDAKSTVLAHDIAQQIENEMQYPGQVKVVVVRESRAVDYAK